MLISVFTLFGQNLAIDWANSHPKVSILSANSYANLSDESKALLGESVLIYQHQFSQQDINAYLQLKESSKLKPITKNTSDENQQVKDWLAVNEHRKCVPHSVHSNFTQQERLLYTEKGALFLKGELLSILDITND